MISKVKNNFKKMFGITLIGVLATSMLLPSQEAFAQPVGLLDGKVMNLGSTFGNTVSTTANLTDSNDATTATLGADNSTNDTIWYKFTSPTSIDSLYYKGGVSQIVVKLYNDTTIYRIVSSGGIGTLGTTIGWLGTTDGTVTMSAVINNVEYIGIGAHDSNNKVVNEFDVFGPPIMPTANTTTTANVLAGSYELTVPSNVNFGDIILNNTSQSITKPLGTVMVGDATGSGQGWRLQIQSTVLTSGSDVLPSNSLLLKSPLSLTTLSGTSVLPTISTGYPWFIDAGSDITILRAGLNEGMGSYSLDFSNADALTLKLPASTKAGSYSSTLTWKIVVGP